MSTIQERLRLASRYTRLDADRELLTEAADEIDRLSAGQPEDVTDERKAFEDWYCENVNRAELPDYLPTLETYSSATIANLFSAWKARAILALRPVQEATPEQKEQSAWCEYVAGMVYGWLQMQRELPDEDRCVKAIAGIINRRMWVLRPVQVPMTENAAPKLIGWRTSDYLMETNDKAVADNWAVHHEMLPIFDGDPHTKLASGITSARKGGEA